MVSITHNNNNPLESTGLITGQNMNKNRTDWIPCRFIVWILSMFGMFTVFGLRVNLSVALVAMVNHTYLRQMDVGVGTNFSSVCPYPVTTNTSSTTVEDNEDGEYEWDEQTQGLILSAFYYGYIFTQFPGGWISSKYGGKWPFGLGILFTGILTLLTPVAASLGVWYIVALRILEGVFEGVTFPAVYAVISNWAPPLERSRMVSAVYVGLNLGTVVSLPVSGYLCKYGFAGGWPSVFYVFGTFSILWFIAWIIFVYDDPKSHPRISQDEQDYIIDAIAITDEKEDIPVPWLSILRSCPVQTLVCVYFCNTWATMTLMTNLPLYMKEVLHFGIEANGVLSALPYAVSTVVMLLSGIAADFLVGRHYCSLQFVRKLFNSLGMFAPAILLLCASWAGCDWLNAVVMFTLAVGAIGLTSPGHCANHLDLTPEFAAMVMALTNTMGTLTGILTPLVVGYLTNHHPTVENWMTVFYISSAISVIGAIVFMIFGSTDKQPWSSTSDKPVLCKGNTVDILKP